MSLSDVDADFVRDIVREHSAIVLDASKTYLIESRLAPVARQAGVGSATDLVGLLRRDRRSKLYDVVVDAMTTNETSFFRDASLWKGMEEHILPALVEQRRASKTLTFWSAACSSGQEPYSLAMLLLERFPQVMRDYNVRIIATDLSAEMLGKSASGRYSQLEVNRGLPAPFLVKHFRRDGTHWQISDQIRSLIEFRAVNLVQPWPFIPAIDVLFCRNVLIYFDLPKKREILARCRDVLRPDGYLLLGGSETTLNIDDRYERVVAGTATTYRPR